MTDEPQQTHEPEPEHKSTVEKVKEAIDKKIESGENSKKIKDAAIHAKESIKHAAENPRQTAHDVAEKVSTAAREAPGKVEKAVFDADSRYDGKKSFADTFAGEGSFGGTIRRGVESTVRGRTGDAPPLMGRGMPNVMPTFGAPKRTSANIFAGNYGNFGFSAGAPVNFGMIGGQRQNPVNFGFQRMSLPSFGAQSGARPPQYGGGMNFGVGFGLPRAAGTGTSNNSPFGGKFSLPLGINTKKKDKDGKERVSPLSLISSGRLNIFGKRVR